MNENRRQHPNPHANEADVDGCGLWRRTVGSICTNLIQFVYMGFFRPMTALIIELMPPMHLDAGMNNSNSKFRTNPSVVVTPEVFVSQLLKE